MRAQRTLFLVGAIAAVAAAPAQSAGSNSGAGPESEGCAALAERRPAETALSARLLELVNGHRRSLGLRIVVVEPALTRSATWKAGHMARHGYVSHADLPGRRTLAQRVRSCGFSGRAWGEVLAAGQRRPSSVLRAWIRSASHRAVIQAPWWRYAGAGVAKSRAGRLYWVLDFGA